MSHMKIILLILVIFMIPGFSYAADYNDWLPFIPDQIEGLKPIDEQGYSKNLSTVTKTFGIGDKQIKFVITSDSTGVTTDAVKEMMELDMDFEGGTYKPVKIQGFSGSYSYEKSTKNVMIMVILKEKTLVTFHTNGNKKMEYYIKLLNTINLKKIADTL